jgi:threonine synthase
VRGDRNAELYLVDRLIDEAGALIKQAVASRPGYRDTSTLREPYRLAGMRE